MLVDVQSMRLCQACDMGGVAQVRHLLARGGDASSSCEGGLSPLYLAARAGHAEVVLVLLDHGADPAAITEGR